MTMEGASVAVIITGILYGMQNCRNVYGVAANLILALWSTRSLVYTGHAAAARHQVSLPHKNRQLMSAPAPIKLMKSS